METPNWNNWVSDISAVAEWTVYWLTISAIPLIFIGLIAWIIVLVQAIVRDHNASAKFRQRGDNGLDIPRREGRLSERYLGSRKHQKWSKGDKRFLEELGIKETPN